MIQIIRYSDSKTFENKKIVISTLEKPRSFDQFNINIIDLSTEDIWMCDLNTTNSINCINDFVSIKTMIEKSKSSKIIIILPQNIQFKYDKSAKGQYREECLLKDMLDRYMPFILSNLTSFELKFYYDYNKTKIGDKEIDSDFVFDYQEDSKDVLTFSVKSEKTTTLRADILGRNTIITTLDLESEDQIMDFLGEIGLLKAKENVPEWLAEIKMFDDDEQDQIILLNREKIKEASSEVDNAQLSLEENNKYKSILYTNGDDLVSVVFEILEQILGYDLSNFKDEKKEDFNLKVGDLRLIGEIKGVTLNVKSEHVLQVERHYQTYLDKLQEKGLEENVKALLIINPLRSKPIADREPIHEIQIKLAEKYQSLIIDTNTLLKIFEKYKNDEITPMDCIDILNEKVGLLEI